MGANASSSTAATSVLHCEGASYHGHQGPSCTMACSSAAATAEHLCGGASGAGIGAGVSGGLVLSLGGPASPGQGQALAPPTVPPPPPPPPFRLGGGDKKRKIAGLATLRKKLIRRRRSSKALDHAKVMREFVAPWDARDLHALAEEYEASAALKDLVVQADLARPPASTYKQDLSALYEHKRCTDVDLLFQGACFPVHRALLSARCPYFRELLSKHPGYGAQVPVAIRTPGIDVVLFSALLAYLYTGEPLVVDPRLGNLELLLRLSEEFGTPNPLEQDLKYLLETGDHADAVLVFSSVECPQGAGDLVSSCGVAGSSGAGSGGSGAGRGAVCSEYGFTAHKLEFLCHKAILSARSPFFRNLIQRRQRNGEELTERALRTPTRIILDESVIPRRYSRVLLQALYLDTVDLAGLLRGSASTSSLSEVQAMVGGGGGGGAGSSNAPSRTHVHPTLADEAMEIYQIGRFLELDILVQGCEDIIVSCLTLENLVAITRWSEQAHGSAWVHRQALQFLREEFQAVAASPVLYELDRRHLIEVLKSDFLQASELEVLQAVLKWGEHQLVKRVEEREPNLLCHTAHSVAKKGVKKRDLSDVELRDILAELLPLVRVDHVLPVNSEALVAAIRRGLVSTPPSHMIGGDVVSGGASAALHFRLSAWLRGQNNGLFVKARLFTPYAEEVKALLDDQMVQEMEMVRLRKVRVSSHIPDTLYMVDEKPLAQSPAYGSTGFSGGLDVVAGAVPVPDSDTVQAMLQREQELRASTSAQRAYALSAADRWEVTRQLQLRVAREFNLPDTMTDVLQTAGYYYPFREDRDSAPSLPPPPPPPKGTGWTRSPSQCHPELPRHSHGYLHSHHLPPYAAARDRRPAYRAAPEDREPFRGADPGAGVSGLVVANEVRPATTRHWGAQVRPENVPCAEGHLSDIIPDIAMATASIGQLRLQDSGELELDLGDRRGHLHSTGPLFL